MEKLASVEVKDNKRGGLFFSFLLSRKGEGLGGRYITIGVYMFILTI